MNAEAQAKLNQLLADFQESSVELTAAWLAVIEQFPEEPVIERLAVTLCRYVLIQTALKELATAVLQERT